MLGLGINLLFALCLSFILYLSGLLNKMARVTYCMTVLTKYTSLLVFSGVLSSNLMDYSGWMGLMAGEWIMLGCSAVAIVIALAGYVMRCFL